MIANEPVEELSELGIHAFTTTRVAGSFGLMGPDPVGEVVPRWEGLHAALAPGASRLVSAKQVHGNKVVAHATGEAGWLRIPDADGHLTRERGTALAITVADCVPVFIAHPAGAIALVHAGWRGTAGGILAEAVNALSLLGCDPGDLRIHLGPAICGACYEVGPDVLTALLGAADPARRTVDLRAVLAGQATNLGVRSVSLSPFCTRCNNDRFYSHRAGDTGRQVAVIAAGVA